MVEDNDLNMEISRFLLENEGACVTEAWNGKEAVELFARSAPGHFDVILMDVMMPEMDGLEATRQHPGHGPARRQDGPHHCHDRQCLFR